MTRTIDPGEFRVPEGARVDREKWPTHVKRAYTSKKKYHRRLEEQVDERTSLQRLHYASNGCAVLVIVQGMDAAGKDGAIRQVMSGVNPQGCQVCSFTQPSAEECEHDVLWRTTRRLPERGRIGIFNRVYSEEVLIVRVHPERLAAQGLPDELRSEKTIHQSKDEQRKRVMKRIDDPDKNWKLSVADVEERQLWERHMQAYEACLSATSMAIAPWYVVPADDEKNTRLIMSEIILELFKGLNMSYPKSTAERRRDLQLIRSELAT